MKKHLRHILLVCMVSILFSCNSEISNFEEADRQAIIAPDYSGIVIPPNIAPMNFKILEPGSEYEVRAFVHKEKPIVIRSKSPVIQFGLKTWRALLQEGKGSDIFMEIFVRGNDKSWKKSLVST